MSQAGLGAGAPWRTHPRPGPDTRLCGPIRRNYRCRGGAYDEYVATNGGRLQAIYSSAAATALNGSVLFIGNSHTREVAEAFMCQRRGRIAAWVHLTRSGCMGSSAYSQRCDGWGSCMDDLSRATLVDGRSIYLAINHPWLYKGIEGLKKAFGLLQLNVTELHTVVAGTWNTDQWAVKKFLFERLPPLCGLFDRSEFLGLHRFDTKEFADILKALGFRGQLLLGGEFGGDIPVLDATGPSDYGFRISPLQRFPSSCSSPDCGARASHQCLPGPPDFVAAEVAGLALAGAA